MKLGMLPRKSSSVCIFTADLVVRNNANAVTLVADVGSTPDASGSGGNFKNTGNVAISTGTGGAWRIYTGNPTGTNRGGLTEVGKRYNADDGSDPLATSNRIYFRIQPTVTIATLNANKVYNGAGADPGFTYNLSGLADGDSTISTGSTLTRAVGKDVGNYAISGASAASDVGYAIGYANTGLLNITTKALTASVAASNMIYDGNATATPTLTITAGLVGTETAGATGAATFNTKDVSTANLVTATSNTLADGANGGLASNYSLTTGQTVAANITPASLTVAADDKSR